jgi:hypothetical protein
MPLGASSAPGKGCFASVSNLGAELLIGEVVHLNMLSPNPCRLHRASFQHCHMARRKYQNILGFPVTSWELEGT